MSRYLNEMSQVWSIKAREIKLLELSVCAIKAFRQRICPKNCVRKSHSASTSFLLPMLSQKSNRIPPIGIFKQRRAYYKVLFPALGLALHFGWVLTDIFNNSCHKKV